MSSKIFLSIVLAVLLGTLGFSLYNVKEPLFGAPSQGVTPMRNVIPETDSTYTLGTTTKTWLNVFTDQLCLNGDCQTTWPSGSGGGAGNVATSTAETDTYVAYWTSTGATPATLGSDAGMVYSSSLDRLTVTHASSSALTSPFIYGTRAALTYASSSAITSPFIYGTTGAITYASSTAITATTFYGALVGNANTATALAANGANCSAGNYPLGVDASGAVEDCTTAPTGIAWPFTPSSYGGVANQSTTTPLWLKDTMVLASTTFFTKASTTMLTNTGNTYFTGITSALGSFGAGGLLEEYAGTSCTDQFVTALSALGAATCASVASEHFADDDWGDGTFSGGVFSVEDNSHAHDATTVSGLGTADISGLDISDDTNLTAGDNLTLTDDDLDLDTTLTGLTRITVSHASTTNFTATYASTSKFFADGLITCNTGNMLTWAGGVFGCEDDTASGIAWPFTPSSYAGVANQSTTTPFWLKDTKLIASSTLVNFASTTVFSADTSYLGTASSTSMTVSNLTNTRIPFASTGGLLADNATLTFDGTKFIATHASTTNESVSANFYPPNGTAPLISGQGSFGIDTSVGQAVFHDGIAARYLSATTSKSFNIASTTLDAMGKNFSAGTSTFLLMNHPQPLTMLGYYCVASSSAKALFLQFGDGTNFTAGSTCAGTYVRTTSNNTFTAFEDFIVRASSTATVTPISRMTVTVVFQETAQ